MACRAPLAVAARTGRARVLRAGDHRFAILVEEAVLRYRIGVAGIMAGQLGRLLSIRSLPAVFLGVVPFSASRHMWPLETFSVHDGAPAQVEDAFATRRRGDVGAGAPGADGCLRGRRPDLFLPRRRQVRPCAGPGP
ncbi:Scr1 family TA system antitoxin-like transcriptional regulator [Streptomyces sp. NBC_00076]|uniref:Scr1 family TA system antitoxin-like transcriptional regulator n=1 Tax=Streptomyces sp. NBC_00076 TaxID=2975642 RepID=UPI003244C210